MSHCGLCGEYINDPHDGWYLCDDCGPDTPMARTTPAHWLPFRDRLRALVGLPPREFRPGDEVGGVGE